jgi:hypothetical protein
MKTLNEEFVEVSYNPFLKSVVVKWMEINTLTDCQKALDSVLETLVCFNCKNVISDLSYGRTYSGIVTDWLRIEFIPKLTNQGVKKIAFLIESNHPNSFFFEKMKKNSETFNNFKVFSNRKELEGWLKDYELIPKPAVVQNDAARFGYFL